MKQTLGKVKKKCWHTFSWYIRLRDWDAQGRQYLEDRRAAKCISCPRMYPIEGKGCLQAGHFIPGRKNQVLFNEEQVNAQCYHCNHHLKGHWTAYYEVMVKKHGQDKVNQMIADSRQIKQYKQFELLEMIEDYKQRAKELEV